MERSSRMWSGLEKLLPPSTLLTFGINMSFGKESVKAHIYENSSLLHPWLSFVNLKAWTNFTPSSPCQRLLIQPTSSLVLH
ncbi:uncharacterized protein ACNLHF_024503 isoform 2-T3 [Anomaloglossus baeobatrachus]